MISPLHFRAPTSLICLRAPHELNVDEKRELKDLILRSFSVSRLEDYEQVAYLVLDCEIVGAVGLYFVEDRLCLNQLCVERAHRRQGIATRLLNFVSIRHPGVTQMLYVDKHTPRADALVKFYCKRGFSAHEREAEFLMLK